MHAYLLDAVRTPFGRHRARLGGVGTDDLPAEPIVGPVRRHRVLAEPDLGRMVASAIAIGHPLGASACVGQGTVMVVRAGD